jgi:twitching motility protein PilT
MARLDPIIEKLFKESAQELLIETGGGVNMRTGSVLQPVLKQNLTSLQILGALAELVPVEQRASFPPEGFTSFSYTAPAGPVQVRLENTQGYVKVSMVPFAELPAPAAAGEEKFELASPVEMLEMAAQAAGPVEVVPLELESPAVTAASIPVAPSTPAPVPVAATPVQPPAPAVARPAVAPVPARAAPVTPVPIPQGAMPGAHAPAPTPVAHPAPASAPVAAAAVPLTPQPPLPGAPGPVTMPPVPVAAAPAPPVHAAPGPVTMPPVPVAAAPVPAAAPAHPAPGPATMPPVAAAPVPAAAPAHAAPGPVTMPPVPVASPARPSGPVTMPPVPVAAAPVPATSPVKAVPPGPATVPPVPVIAAPAPVAVVAAPVTAAPAPVAVAAAPVTAAPAPVAAAAPVSAPAPIASQPPAPMAVPAPAPAHEPASPAAAPGLAADDTRDARQQAEAQMRAMMEAMLSRGASDLHLTSETVPRMRIDGDMVGIEEYGRISHERLKAMILSIAPEKNRRQFEELQDTDFAYEMPAARFRINIFEDRRGIGAVLRQIPKTIRTAEEIGLTKHVLDLCFLSKGLVLVTGPTGSGKSTTLAALIDYVNRHREDHIITVEDPIEFVHRDKGCLVNQREVGVHTRSFKNALRAALREDPDVVLVGEMRDLETIATAIETAETGHLVFGTLHTNTAASTVDRIIDQFPADRQAQIRMMLSESLKAVVAQTLCKRIGGGRVAAQEVLLVTGPVSNLIREGKTFQIPSVMQTSRGQGMVMLNDALLDLVKRKVVDPNEALSKSVSRAELRAMLERAGFKVDTPVEPAAPAK